MRFTISREKLLEGLSAVSNAVPAKTTLPVLANLLVETTERGIRLSATDLDIAVSTEVSADVESAGRLLTATLRGNSRSVALVVAPWGERLDPLWRIAVLYGDDEAHGSLVRQALDAAELPWHAAIGRPLATSWAAR